MNASMVRSEHSALKLLRSGELHPPQKPLPFIPFDASKSAPWLNENVQPAWWRRDYQVTVCSDFDAANTCKLYQERITKLSGGLVKLPTASTASEWCLMREIIWMLQIEPDADTDGISKFFNIAVDKMEIVPNQNVSLASVTVDGIRSILAEFATHMTILYRFRLFLRSVFGKKNETDSTTPAPHTIECYANAIQGFTTSISTFLLATETELMRQDPMVVHSVVKLFNDLHPFLKQMQHLYAIHVRCYVDFRSHPNHVSAMYLLAALSREIDTAATKECLNLSTSLLLEAIKFYLSLFDGWWIEGRFDDWRKEFLIERLNDIDAVTSNNPTTNIYRAKPIVLDDGVPKQVLETIRSCKLLRLMSKQSLEAGYIINILYNLDKLSDMRLYQIVDDSNNFYGSFLSNVFHELEKFDKRLVVIGDEYDTRERVGESEETDATGEQATAPTASKAEAFRFDFGIDCNPLLAMVFEQYAENALQLERNDAVETATDLSTACEKNFER